MLRGSATLLAGGAAGAVTAHGISRTASATATAEFAVSGDEVTVRQQQIKAVTLALDAAWSYQVPSGEHPARVQLTVLAGTSEEELQTVASATSDATFLESSGEESFSVDLLEQGVVTGDALVPAEGGATNETTVHLGVEMRLFDEDDVVIAAASARDTATLAVTKSSYDPNEHGDVSGDGQLTIELG